MPSDARKLSDWLQQPNGALRDVLSRTDRLVELNREFREWLQEPWADAIRIATCDGDTAVLYAAHAAAATLLRFRAPAVLAFLRERYNPVCTQIQISVQPDTYTAK